MQRKRERIPIKFLSLSIYSITNGFSLVPSPKVSSLPVDPWQTDFSPSALVIIASEFVSPATAVLTNLEDKQLYSRKGYTVFSISSARSIIDRKVEECHGICFYPWY